MAKMYYEKDCDLSLLEGKTIAVVGTAAVRHAQNLRQRYAGGRHRAV